MWINLTLGEVEAIRELDTLPDRAAGIVGATILESRLRDRLKHETPSFTVKERSTLHERMFNPSGPVGSFSAQITLGFMLKLYDEQAWRDLDAIRGIRNDFAHQTEIGSFSQQRISARCRSLRACDLHFSAPNTDDPRYSQGSVSTAQSGKSLEMKFYVLDLATKLADPRQRYLLCIMYYSAFLGFPLAFRMVGP
jgi:hypothetical protein